MAEDPFHKEMLQRAIDLSKKAVEHPEIHEPFGAVVVRNSDRKIIGEGCNDMWELTDPSRHGEVVAISRACKTVGSLKLPGCTLYSSCEPCAMCASLIWWTQIDQVYYANKDDYIRDVNEADTRELTKHVATPSEQRANYTQMMGREAETVIRDWHRVKFS